MNVENKYPQNAVNANRLQIEVFRNRYTNKVSYRDERGIIRELEYSENPANTTLGGSIWANGFRIIGCIGEDITLPDNTNIEFTGPLAMCAGATLTVSAGTTLTIV
jgi:hypothetical protein